ncbi:hypothetical protein [Auraticoccus monumenti]|uniref:Uncharacterized protein n=1 Tax=Auraticoccus monumenti TaxID=675864 RepID=A0A1G6S072_9ACTN|nr:hypothetical protein [Auraticoccus monumenti]SDD10259.1 hypothetical protein SAMN04489747_0177 [Auraticoccus monumenti]
MSLHLAAGVVTDRVRADLSNDAPRPPATMAWILAWAGDEQTETVVPRPSSEPRET